MILMRQVAQIREQDISDIVHHVWDTSKNRGRLNLSFIQTTLMHDRLLKKFPKFKFLIDGETSSMLRQERFIDEEPHYLDNKDSSIGYKVMDTISYAATYGYRTIFAYVKEVEKWTLKK